MVNIIPADAHAANADAASSGTISTHVCQSTHGQYLNWNCVTIYAYSIVLGPLISIVNDKNAPIGKIFSSDFTYGSR